MISPPIPDNEAERLADLYALRILDTPPEDRFDQIVRLASSIFDVPIAYIALVDSDRQWFKAKCGLQAEGTERDISFCGFTILKNSPLIIEDAANDERFADNPLVTDDPFIRFYAGYPLRGPNGYNVGTLCLADRKPRSLESQQHKAFQTLAELSEYQINLVGLVETQRELIRTKNALIETRETLAKELAQAAAYVESLLPEHLHGDVESNWKFVSSSELGGDIFGHHWLEPGQLAFYLLDVCGHGVGAALLSISAFNALRRQTLPNTDFMDPSAVLSALNTAFPMSAHGEKYFTAIYGVYDVKSRKLQIANAGHPPALIFAPGQKEPRQIKATGLPVGLVPQQNLKTKEFTIDAGSRMYLFSDGAYEVRTKDGMFSVQGLIDLLVSLQSSDASRVQQVYERVLAMSQPSGSGLDDDFSILEFRFS